MASGPSGVVGSEQDQGTTLPLTGVGLTLLHQAPQQYGIFDDIRIWVTNLDTVDRTLTIFWGSDADPGAKIPMTIPPGVGPVNIIPGWPLERGLTVKGQASAANVLNVITLVNRISPYT